MALYDITAMKGGLPVSGSALVRVEKATFATLGIQERSHLQAALRDRIELIDEQLLVVAEEFGDFEGANRRIDLLCLDKTCRLVVVELKRTADGGHMELQALRYAAMVSTMTFAQVANALSKYRKHRGDLEFSEAQATEELLAWLDLDDDDSPTIRSDVGVVLASEDFSQEITTTVLWLNEFHDFDIRCVRLSPYVLDDRVLLDVQAVIPLPEASQYTVRVREKEKAVRQASSGGGADWTKFTVVTPAGASKPLPKRWAMLELVKGMAGAGVDMRAVEDVLPNSKLLRVEGQFANEDDLWAAVQRAHGNSDVNRKRWHLQDSIEADHATWVLNNNWGTKSREFFAALVDLAPPGFAVHEEGPSSPSTDPVADL